MQINNNMIDVGNNMIVSIDEHSLMLQLVILLSIDIIN
jgi:hypothetical protein